MTVFDRTWVGVTQTDDSTTAGDYSAADNWLPISLRNGTYRWLASGSGTNEFYLDLSGGGDPGVAEPANVQELIGSTRTNMTAGTVGSLAAGEWDYGDNDSLGYSTIYVRMTSAGPDPDDVNLDFLTMTAIPQTGDHVRIPASSTQAISSGLDQSAVAIGDFIVEKGWSQNIAADGTPLYIDPNRFEFQSDGGQAYIDIGSASIDVQVFGTATPPTGQLSLYLTGSAIDECFVRSGSVGLAARHGETATVATLRVTGGSVYAGNGLSLTTVLTYGGSTTIDCAFTTGNVFAGTFKTTGTGAVTTLNTYGGNVYPQSTGTVTTLLVQGATVDTTKAGIARTLTNVKLNSGEFKYDKNVVTITTWTTPDFPIQYIAGLPS